MPLQPRTIAIIPNCDSMVGLPKYIHPRQRYLTPELMFTQSASTARYQIHGWKLAWPYLEQCRLNTSTRSSVVKCKGRAYRHIVHVFNRLSTDTGAPWAQAFPAKTALCPGFHCIAFFPTILYLTRPKDLSFGRSMICPWSWKGIFLTPLKHMVTVACWQVFLNRRLTNTIFLTPMKHMIMACLSKLVPSRKNINNLLRWSTHLQTYPDDQSNDVSELGSNDISACHILNAPTSDGVGSAFIHSWLKNRHLPVAKPQSIRDNSFTMHLMISSWRQQKFLSGGCMYTLTQYRSSMPIIVISRHCSNHSVAIFDIQYLASTNVNLDHAAVESVFNASTCQL